MEVNAQTPRARLLDWLGPIHRPYASSLGDDELRISHCEGLVAAHVRDHGFSQRKASQGRRVAPASSGETPVIALRQPILGSDLEASLISGAERLYKSVA